MGSGQEVVCRFAVYFDDLKEEVYGDLVIRKEAATHICIDFIPQFPGWAKNNRKMKYEINIGEDKLYIYSVMSDQ